MSNQIAESVRAAVEELTAQCTTQQQTEALLAALESAVADLKAQLLQPHQPPAAPKKPVRVYLDGCFDIMHSGHYNALRQAKSLGDILVVGIHSDEEILKNKGPTTMNNEERVKIVKACKWVDEIYFDAPYSPSVAVLDKLNCDFGVHGDDMPTAADGSSAYAEIIKANRCRIIKRTEGVSTTDLVGRMLLMTRDHHLPPPAHSEFASSATAEDKPQPKPQPVLNKSLSAFLPTTQRILQFSNFANGANHMKNPSKIVYIAGSFDLFHVGHVDVLEKAKQLGDFLLVGVHSDRVVNEHKGKNYPIMNLHERVLNVLSCKFVDEVILGAPWIITKDMITTMNIKVVVHIKGGIDYSEDEQHPDAYEAARSAGLLEELSIDQTTLTTDAIVERILSNRQRFEKRNAVRAVKEMDYLSTKQYIPEL